jgi:hypothetical protein
VHRDYLLKALSLFKNTHVYVWVGLQLIARFAKSMSTDKVIIAFVCLVLSVIGGIIAYATLGKGKDSLGAPDLLAPPGTAAVVVFSLRGRGVC